MSTAKVSPTCRSRLGFFPRLPSFAASCVQPPRASPPMTTQGPMPTCTDCVALRTGHIMADAHVFWQLDGSLRVMVYSLVVAHVGALVCSTATNPATHPLPTPTQPGGRCSGVCRSVGGRRPMQRSHDYRRQCALTRGRPLSVDMGVTRSLVNGARDDECLFAGFWCLGPTTLRVPCVVCVLARL